MTEVAAAALAGLSVAEATPQTAANHGMPPGRVRHVFKTLDTDGDGTLSIEELKTGFAKEFKVVARMDEMFSLHADEKDGAKALGRKKFSRFYAEVLFRHFDADNSNTRVPPVKRLELVEVQKALKHMIKPSADGEQATPIVAFPPEFTTESGEIDEEVCAGIVYQRMARKQPVTV